MTQEDRLDRLAESLERLVKELHAPPLMTAREAAEYWNCDPKTLQQIRAILAKDGRDIAFAPTGEGGRVMFSRRAMDYVEAQALGLPYAWAGERR